MVIAGQGVAMGRTTLVAQDLAEGRLVRPFGPALACPLGYYLVCRMQDADNPVIAAFRAWLLAQVSDGTSSPHLETAPASAAARQLP